MSSQKRQKHAPLTLPMLIAHSQNLSAQYAGMQMSGAYLAANSLSMISIIVGLCITIPNSPTLQHIPPYLSYPLGAIIGTIAAYIFDGLTISSLRRIRNSKHRLTQFVNSLLMAGGVIFSTIAGDQMWSLFFSDWKAPAFACAISAVLISVELWPAIHKEAVNESVKRDSILADVVKDETNAKIDTIRRDEIHRLLEDQDIRERLNEGVHHDLFSYLQSRMKEGQTIIEPITDEVAVASKQLIAVQENDPITDPHITTPGLDAFELDLLQAIQQRPELCNTLLQLCEDGRSTQEAAQLLQIEFPDHDDRITEEVTAHICDQLIHETDTTPIVIQHAPEPRKKRAITATSTQPRTKFDARTRTKLARILHDQPNTSKRALAIQFGVSPNTIKVWIEQLHTEQELAAKQA